MNKAIQFFIQNLNCLSATFDSDLGDILPQYCIDIIILFLYLNEHLKCIPSGLYEHLKQ